MKNRRLPIIVLLLICSWINLSKAENHANTLFNSSFAKRMMKTSFELKDEQSINGHTFLRLFNKSIFSFRSSRGEQVVTPDALNIFQKTEKQLSEEFPWLYPYFFMETEKPPSFGVVNKWTKPIIVSTGLPNNFKPANKPFENELFQTDFVSYWEPQYHPPYTKRQKNLEDKIKSHANDLLEDISRHTGSEIRYLDYKDETSEEYGNLRIVYSDSVFVPEQNKFKPQFMREISSSRKPFYHYSDFEDQLDYKVNFVSEGEDTVHGYFLTNGKNEIEFAVCYLWSGHDEETMARLIKECLVKSMGMPFADLEQGASISSMNQLLLQTLYDQGIKAGQTYNQSLRSLDKIIFKN